MNQLFDISSDDEDIIDFVEHLERPRKRRRYQERKNHLDYWDDQEFYNRFRFSKPSVRRILEKIEEAIKSPTNWNHALSPIEMLLLTLRYYACGSMLIVVGDFAGVHKSTASKAIFKVTQAIASLRLEYIKFPETQEERNKTQLEFYKIARFPRVLGALDCTHVRIQAPGGENGETFRNRKGFFSFNVQTVSDANLKILDIVARWPGSSHDSTIFNQSRLCGRCENNEMGNGLLMGDGGYPLKSYLITPLANTNTRAENLFNEAQIRTRNPVERSYGVWKRRFPILSSGISLKTEKVQWIIVATAVLNNMACDLKEQDPPSLSPEEERAFNFVNNVPVEPVRRNGNNNHARTNLIMYFENL
jgi:hypothetical protein